MNDEQIMSDGVEPREGRTVRLGIAAFRFDPETIQRMLRFLEVPWESARIETVTDEALSETDAVLLVNPTLNAPQWDSVFRHVEAGGSALTLLTPSLTAHTESLGVLARLSLLLGYTRPVKKLNLCYSHDYPVAHKRANGDHMLCHVPTRFATFRSSAGAEQHVPLISAKFLMSRPCIVMQVNWGRGEFVFSNSAGLPEDRADIVTHLLKTAAGRRPQAASAPPAPNADELVDAISGLFEVYDEIPLDVVARELATKSAAELNRLDLLGEIEKCIRSGELAARIRGNTIVRAW